MSAAYWMLFQHIGNGEFLTWMRRRVAHSPFYLATPDRTVRAVLEPSSDEIWPENRAASPRRDGFPRAAAVGDVFSLCGMVRDKGRVVFSDAGTMLTQGKTKRDKEETVPALAGTGATDAGIVSSEEGSAPTSAKIILTGAETVFAKE